MVDFLHFLKNTSYPGRGILVGKDRVYYFIMGRSENSRNRVFVKTDDGIRTEAFDPAKLADPSLIIYHPVRTMGSDLVVTNGDQTDTICEHGDFRRGLMTREYEPDEPNWTPRISAIMHEDGSFELSILKRKDGRCLREFFCYEGCDEGKGYFISTYQGDGSPLPTFAGEPKEVELPEPEAIYGKYPHELSGGMLQRAMIAAAIVNRPKLLLLDEPTTALDVTIQAQILEMLKKLNRESGVSMLFISHNLNVVRKLCRRVAVMQRGVLVEEGDTDQVFYHPQHPYTQKLIDAIPTRNRKEERP